MDDWAFLLAGIVAVHVASAVVVMLAMWDEERAEVHKNDARIVESESRGRCE